MCRNCRAEANRKAARESRKRGLLNEPPIKHSVHRIDDAWDWRIAPRDERLAELDALIFEHDGTPPRWQGVVESAEYFAELRRQERVMEMA